MISRNKVVLASAVAAAVAAGTLLALRFGRLDAVSVAYEQAAGGHRRFRVHATVAILEAKPSCKCISIESRMGDEIVGSIDCSEVAPNVAPGISIRLESGERWIEISCAADAR
jgi:hypothetical protein